MDITTLSADQLKVLAYDTLANLEQLQRNLQAINQEIAKHQQAPQPSKES